MDKLAPTAARLEHISRDLSLIPKEERRALFVERARTVADLVRDGLLNASAVHEKLWQIAHAHNSSDCHVPSAKNSSPL
jgi:hypothetical protein